MNTKRYPDFKEMVAHFHKAGIKVVPNVKPCDLIFTIELCPFTNPEK